MADRRRFIGWNTPILQETVRRLRSTYARGRVWDMRRLVIVLPSGLARRRLNELLTLEAERQGLILYLPEVVTVGVLPERLYRAKLPFASDLVQQLTWMRVLLAFPAEDLSRIVPVPPPKGQIALWLELSKVLAGLHRELASERLDFADVAENLKDHPEAPRWQALSRLQRQYLNELDALQLWDIQTARTCALDLNEAATDKEHLIVGCVDLNRTQRGFLEAIKEKVEIWVAAPEAQSHLFDLYGCLRCESWKTVPIDIPPEHLLVGNSPVDQAELAVGSLAELNGDYHVRDVTLGVPDNSLVPELKHRLKQVGLRGRFGPGTSLAMSEPAKLLTLIGHYCEQRTYASFAALVRHPAIDSLLRRMKIQLPPDWLSRIDKYYQSALPKQIDGYVNQSAPGATVFRLVTGAIDRWLSKLSGAPRPLSAMVDPLLDVLSRAYAKQFCDLEDAQHWRLYQAASQVSEVILGLRDIPSRLQPKLTAAGVIEWLLSGMNEMRVPEPSDTTALEMLGWLELPWDDAPALVVTGLHDGVVPESVNGDAFLPNGLRKRLGAIDNDRRYARDAYTMQLLMHSRRVVRFVVGKTDQDGDPLVPSRLLMAGNLADLPARVLHLVQESQTDVLPPIAKAIFSRPQDLNPGRTGRKRNAAVDESAVQPEARSVGRRIREQAGRLFEVPHPDRLNLPDDFQQLAKVSVTAFRDYLQCPYRFFLRHVLKLRSEHDALSEMDAPQFGVLVHDVLTTLRGPIGQETDPDAVRCFLVEQLHRLAEERFGSNPAAAVLIQVEQAELRLAALAEHQAQRAAQGWEIRHVETGIDEAHGERIGRDGELLLIGRIDRIDFHPGTGRWAIWDYKTSENAKHPEAVHWSKKHGWQDLQLPLYRRIAKHLGVSETPSLGYISIPKQAAKGGFFEANFSLEQMREADELADELASRMAAGQFWNGALEAQQFDDFARICRVNVQQVLGAGPTRAVARASESRPTTLTRDIIERAEGLLQNDQRCPPVGPLQLPPLMIRASAGTGKTFQLSNRLLQILLSGQEVDSILATTFTRKAAGEITQRVLERLARACCDSEARRELERHVPGVDTSLANCLACLRRVTGAIHRLRIGTLDSFFAQVAKTFSFELGLPPGWNAMDPVQEPRFQLQSISRMLDNHDRRKLVDLVRMLAKGESGRQVAEDMRRTVEAGHAVYRNSDAEAWDQLALLPAPSESAVESALATLENSCLQQKRADEQLEKLHLLARTGNWEEVIGHGIYAKLQDEVPSYYRRELPAELITALRILAERSAAELLSIRRNQTLASHALLAAYDAEYTSLIRQYRLFAFADITHYLSQWLAPAIQPTAQRQTAGETRRTGDSATIEYQRLEFRLDCGVQHLLLDEFQDTAPEQWNILEPLATPLVERDDHGGRRSVFCVGDTKQAIYGWRGGVSEVFEAVGRSLPGMMQEELRESYRSSPQVIEAVNRVFGNLTAHDNFADCSDVAESWSGIFPAHRTARDDLKGYVQMLNGPQLNRTLPLAERQEAWLKFSATRIAELARQSSVSVGVLFRTNAGVSRMIAMLRNLGISASQDGGSPLNDSAAVELVLSLMHLADHPGDSICGFHLTTSPLLDAILDASGIRQTGVTGLPGPSGTVDRQLCSQLALWFRQQVFRRGLGSTIELVFDLLADKLTWWERHRLEQLIRLGHEFEAATPGRLREFEEMVEHRRIGLPSEAQVKVMTIHKSKGLEFDAVFLPDLDIDIADSTPLFVERGDDPCSRPNGVIRYMNASLQAMLPESWQRAFRDYKRRIVRESLCLLYVAMTRAKNALYMTTRPSKSSSQQLGAILQSTLGETGLNQQPEVVLYEDGDPQWWQTSARSTGSQSEEATRSNNVVPAEQITSDPELTIALRTDAQSAPVRGLTVSAPSQLGHSSTTVPVSHAFSITESLGATYGTLIHAFFEQIEWLDDFELDRSQLHQIARSCLSPAETQLVSIDEALDDFAQMLRRDSVRAALSAERYRKPGWDRTFDRIEVENERVISLTSDSRLISGTIDRLVVLVDGEEPVAAEIIDYKTDAYDPDLSLLWREQRVEHHRPQLQIYSQVVSKLFRIPEDRISSYLVLLSTDELVRVD